MKKDKFYNKLFGIYALIVAGAAFVVLLIALAKLYALIG